MHHQPQTGNEMSITHLLSKREALAAELAAHEEMIEEARKAERTEALDKIKALMAEHGVTAEHLGSKATKPARKKAEPKDGAVVYNVGGTRYVQGQRGRVPAAVVAAREAGTLDHYRVAA
jgi:DNA-binding protein H-NS